MQVQNQLAILKNGSDSVTNYYHKVKLLCDTLATVGKPFSPSEFITHLLADLDSDYESVVTSITTQVDPLTPPQVYSHFLTYEARLSHQITALLASPKLSTNLTTKSSSFYSNHGDRGGRGDRGGYRACRRGSRNPSLPPSNHPVC